MGRDVNQHFFDKISAVYDTDTAGDWNSPSVIAAKAKPLLGAGSKLLDFGVGTGQVLTALDISPASCSVFAVDVAPGMVGVCQKKFPCVNVRQIASACDILRFGWPQFDVILSSGVFEYVERIDRLLCTLKKLLAPGGELFFTYQPIISHHPKQSTRVTRNSRTADVVTVIGEDIARGIETITYRWHAHEVYDFACVAGLEIAEQESFVAYHDVEYHDIGSSKMPRIYNLVRSKSSPSSG